MFHWVATASSSGTKKEVEGMMLPAILFLFVAMEMVEHCSATQRLFPASPGDNHILQKRQTFAGMPSEVCNRTNERAIVRDLEIDNLVWTCNSSVWIPNWLNPKPSIGTFETLPARSCQQIRDVLDCARVTPSGQYWIKVSSGGGSQDCCQQGEDFEVMKMFCEMELDGGGWTLVWKHSYREVGDLTEDMKYFSSTLEPCYNLSVGWCNFPCKERLHPTEMAIAAYHEGTMVYSYKAGFNRNIDNDWRGGVLMEPVKLMDRCRHFIDDQPTPYRTRDESLLGLAFGKTSSGDYHNNGNTIGGTLSHPHDRRWHHCGNPLSEFERYNTQMTMAIYVR